MKPDIEYIKKLFEQYNKELFNSSLPILPMRIGNSKSALGRLAFKKHRKLFGKYVYSDFKLVISSRYDQTEQEVQDTLIHEMIHYYILYHQNHDTSPHGKMFKEIMNNINTTYGRHISVSKKCTKEDLEQDKHIKPHYFCVSEIADGRTGITVAATTRVIQLWRLLPTCFKLKSTTWYWSKDPYFNRFPNSRTPRIMVVDRQELNAHLLSATELECDGHTMKAKQTSI